MVSRGLATAHHALPVTDGQQVRRLPIVIWSRLYHDLEPYLSWRSADGTTLMALFHTGFNEIADQLFLDTDTVRRARHDALATHFLDQADPDHNQSWKVESPRPLLHVRFHLAGASRGATKGSKRSANASSSSPARWTDSTPLPYLFDPNVIRCWNTTNARASSYNTPSTQNRPARCVAWRRAAVVAWSERSASLQAALRESARAARQ